jgi:hypothetical protein
MQISWNGLGSFTITGKPIEGDITLVTDPYQNSTGLRFPRTLSASIVVSSHDGVMANSVASVAGEEKKKPFVVDHAGEYEVQGIFVTGLRAPKKDKTEHTIYRFGLEDIRIGFLGAIDRKLSDKEVEALGSIDVLILPVGGGGVLSKDEASELVAQIEPRLVIPSHFNVQGLKEKLEDVEGFCKEVACPKSEEKKLKITKSSLPAEDMQIVVLEK